MEKKLPLISVITTVYNTEKYVERCFESIFNQTYKNIEFIIVNNASEGNINEIVDKYKYIYPDFKIKLVELKENVGLFHGRLKGAEVATGSYIAFIDSDDRVSVDFYRQLIEKASNTLADMVVADFVYEDENNNLTHDIYNPVEYVDLELSGNNIFDKFIKQEARSFYWNLVWNKIYSIDLWNKCKPYFELNKNKIVMCDDIIYSFVLYKFSKKMVTVSDVKYYYYKHSNANSNANSKEKLERILLDIANVFSFCETFINIVNENKQHFYEWKCRYFRMWKNGIIHSNISNVDKKILVNLYREKLKLKDEIKEDKTDWFFIEEQEVYDDSLEEIRKKIIDVKYKYISFDIFDTLIVRHVWEPADLFKFLNKIFNEHINSNNYIMFSDIRSFCEHKAMERAILNDKKEISLDDIYNEIEIRYKFNNKLLNEVKKYEMILELKLCEKRKMVYNLYKMAVAIGKKVICISDMYLPLSFIKSLLKHNQYENIEKIYLSSSIGVTKRSSELFKYAINDLNIDKKNILHIGDNLVSDIKMAKKVGIDSLYIQRTMDAYAFFDENQLIKEKFMEIYNTNNMMMHNLTIFENIGSRCLMAVAINKLMDNPFILNKNSCFGKNPYFLGYFLLGIYIYGVARWILEKLKKGNYKQIHFMSRDGFLIKKAFDILNETSVKSNYFYSSRKSLLPFAVENKNDFWGLSFYIYPLDYSPKKIVEIFENSLLLSKDDTIDSIIKNNFIYDKYFNTKEEFDLFINYFSEKLFSYDKNSLNRLKMKNLLKNIINKEDCIFDIGYSGRSESIFKDLLGYPINALYLYRNYYKSIINERKHDFSIEHMFNYFPNIANEIFLELLISDTNNSCKKYILGENKLEYVFDNNKQDYITVSMINFMHKGAIDFIEKVKYIYNDIQDDLYFNKIDLSYPLEYWMKKSDLNELSFLKYALFDDVLDKNMKQNVLNYENRKIDNNCNYDYNSLNKFQKIILLAITNRGLLKYKVKFRLRKHEKIKNILGCFYKIIRKIYRMWRV